MGALAGLAQAELRAPAHRGPPEGQKGPQHLGKRKDAGHPSVDHEEVAGVGALKRGELVELGQDALGVRAPLELHHHPQPFPVGLVAQVAYALKLPLLHLGGDGLEDRAFAHLIGDLGDHDLVALDEGPAAQDEPALARGIGLADALLPTMTPPVGKSGPGRRGRSSSTVASG